MDERVKKFGICVYKDSAQEKKWCNVGNEWKITVNGTLKVSENSNLEKTLCFSDFVFHA